MNSRRKTKLKGIPASPGGMVRGRVKIIQSLSGIGKLKKGDILVSSFLTPDFLPFVKKISSLSGIITDKGCSTCHAAILARELGIPYIAATFSATKKLKNNAEIIMDSDKGIIYEC
jgi:phosphoenolpyruvate synthase/pyruvate phosphate dikinase